MSSIVRTPLPGDGSGASVGFDIQGIEDRVNQLEGSENSDRINGGNLDDVLKGLAGDDTIFGKGGNDELSGGDGDDFLSGGAGKNVIPLLSLSEIDLYRERITAIF